MKPIQSAMTQYRSIIACLGLGVLFVTIGCDQENNEYLPPNESSGGDRSPDDGEDVPEPSEIEQRTTTNDFVGVSLRIPGDWAIKSDPVKFKNDYGLLILGPDNEEGIDGSHDRLPIARVALRTDRGAHELHSAVEQKMDQYSEFDLERFEVTVGDGRTGVALTGLPGVSPYSVVFVRDGERLYEIGLWSDESGEFGNRELSVLKGLRFRRPTLSLADLGLEEAEVALYAAPEAEIEARNAQAQEQRSARLMASAESGDSRWVPHALEHQPSPEGSAKSCSFAQPNWLLWQLQWDNTNAFYSGDWYNLRSNPGWSAMSGNYGSWWGTNYHVWKCNPNVLNQWYANDWPAYYGDNVYSAFSGWVEWAGWGTDGYYTLGRYVVVHNGSGYRSLSAHFTSIPSWIYWGAKVKLDTVIGFAGGTGGDWAPHIHARIAWGESLTANGQPYGGQSVWPIGLRCWTCNNPDFEANVGGWYNSFWHGRWMRH